MILFSLDFLFHCLLSLPLSFVQFFMILRRCFAIGMLFQVDLVWNRRRSWIRFEFILVFLEFNGDSFLFKLSHYDSTVIGNTIRFIFLLTLEYHKWNFFPNKCFHVTFFKLIFILLKKIIKISLKFRIIIKDSITISYKSKFIFIL